MRKKYVVIKTKINVELLTIEYKDGKLKMYIQANCKKNKECKNKQRMMNMDISKRKQERINAFDAANYIIHLYYKSEKKYRCTRAKIEKLLSIAGFWFMAKYGKPLYDQEIEIKSCGTGFSEFSRFYPPDIIKTDQTETNNKIEDYLEVDVEIPTAYQDGVENLNNDNKKLLYSVFMMFGNYEQDKLGKAIDRFKEEIAVDSKLITDRRVVDAEKSKEYFSKSNNLTSKNISEEKISEQVNDLYEQLVGASSTFQKRELEIKDLLKSIVKSHLDSKKIIHKTLHDIFEYIGADNGLA